MTSTHKKRLLMWLSVTTPELPVTDLFPKDWSDGTYLSLLLRYCLPSDHHSISEPQSLSALLQIASDALNIPPLLHENALTSKEADFILLMYLYYFVKPGLAQLLQWVRRSLDGVCSAPTNFEESWSDGGVIYQLVNQLTSQLMPPLDTNKDVEYITGLVVSEAEKTLAVHPHFAASELSTSSSDAFPLILFLAQLQSVNKKSGSLAPKVFIQRDVEPLQCVGSRVSIELDCKDCPDADMQAVVMGHDQQPQPMHSTQSSEKGVTTFSYTPNHVGHFSISITCNGSEIAESPVDFDTYNPDKCELIDTLKEVYLIEQPITLKISTKGAGKGELTASLSLVPQLQSTSPVPRTGSANSKLLPDVTKVADDKYQVSFTPEVAGTYQLLLLFNNTPTQDQLSLTCKQVSFTSTSICTPATIRHSLGDKNTAVSVSDPQGGQVIVQSNSDGSYSYTPPEAGLYHISIHHNQQPIKDSPFTVFHPDIYVRVYPEGKSFVGQPITTIVDASDQNSCDRGAVRAERFAVTIRHNTQTNVCTLPVSVQEMLEEKQVFTIQFTPEEMGTYSMNISYYGEQFPSPEDREIIFEVVEPNIFLRPLSPPPYLVGRPITAKLDASQADSLTSVSEDVIHIISQKENITAQVSKVEQESNIFTITFTPQNTGLYSVNVLCAGEEKMLSFEVTQPSLSDPNLSVRGCSHDDTNCIVHVDLHAGDMILEGFRQQPIAQHTSPHFSSEYSIIAVGKDTKRVLYPDFRQERDDRFSIIIHTDIPDVYELRVFYYGELISCCPFPVDISSKVIMYDPVIPLTVAGPNDCIELVLDTSNSYKTSANDFTVRVFSSATKSLVPTTVVEESPNLFRASFLPSGDDSFHVKVCWFCLPIDNSPVTISYKQQTVPPPISIRFQPNTGPRVSVAALLETKVTSQQDQQNKPPHEDQQNKPPHEDQQNKPPHEDQQNKPPHEDQLQPPEKGPTPHQEPAQPHNPDFPLLTLQQYERGSYQISLFSFREKQNYLLHLFCLGKEIAGSPFLIDTSKFPWHPNRDELTTKNIGNYCVFSAKVKVQGQSVPIVVKATADLATITFEDRKRYNYDLYLYCNYISFKGAPFSLTKHHQKK